MRYCLPIPLAGNFVLHLQWFLFINLLLRRRFSRAVTWAAELLGFGICMYVSLALKFMTFARMLCAPSLLTLLFIALYREKWYRPTMLNLIVLVMIITSELMAAAFLYTPADLAGEIYRGSLFHQALIYLTVNVLFGAQLWSLFLLLQRFQTKLTWKQALLCMGFLISMAGCLFGYIREASYSAYQGNADYLFLSVLFCVIFSVLLFQYMLGTVQRVSLEAENHRLAAQMDAQMRRYEEITAQYEAVRHMRHDIRKHLTAMEALLESGNQQEARAYIADLKTGAYIAAPQICQHPVVDALLHRYEERAAAEGVRLELQIQIPADIAISSADLVCVFGNLMDNALEACAQAGQKEVRLICALVKAYLVISVENSYCFGAEMEKPRHTPQLERGIGTQVLEHIAQKYHGDYTTRAGEQRYLARVALAAKENGS